MAKKIFYSFHYIPDNWRVSQVRNIGSIEGNKPAKDNDWEEITDGGDKKIEEWISDQMHGTSCTVVLIGSNTANRKWINHEIRTTWNKGKGILGINIHNLLNKDGNKSIKGKNPFDYIGYGNTGKALSSIVKTYDPPYSSSKFVYDHISENISEWIENAIEIRKNN